jgi:hypothetical protein
MAMTAALTGKAIINAFHVVSSAISGAFDFVKRKASEGFNVISGAAKRLGHDLSGMWDGLKNGFRAAVNFIIRGWNDLHFTIGGGSFLGMSIPSVTFDTPNIPYLAHGGVAGGLIMAGERGRELIRVPHGSTVIPHGQTENMIGQGGSVAKVLLGFERNSGSRLMDAIVDGLQTYVKARGGNVQVALGRHGA